MKLLIAEDSLTMRLMLQGLVKQWGFESTLAEDGQQAWEILQTETLPLMLIDWEMPGMNGPELCQKIREIKTNRPPFIILLTSRDATHDIVKGLAAGANDYVSKPFKAAELCARLQVGQRMILLQDALLKAERQLVASQA